jgi:hypothetical protein
LGERRVPPSLQRKKREAAAAFPLLQADKSLGWHGAAYGYMINMELVEQNPAGLKNILDHRIPEERGKL